MVDSDWFLADGILTALFFLFLLFHQAFTMLSLPHIVSMRLLVSGISKFANSFGLKRLGVLGWGWFTTLGIPLIFQGIASILQACFSHRLWR